MGPGPVVQLKDAHTVPGRRNAVPTARRSGPAGMTAPGKPTARVGMTAPGEPMARVRMTARFERIARVENIARVAMIAPHDQALAPGPGQDTPARIRRLPTNRFLTAGAPRATGVP